MMAGGRIAARRRCRRAEDQPLQVVAQLRDPVGRVAGEVFQRGN